MTDIIMETPREVVITPTTKPEEEPTKVELTAEAKASDSKHEEIKKEETKKEEEIKKEEIKKEEETKKEEEIKKEEETKQEEVPKIIDSGHLHKRAPRFMKRWSRSYFAFGTEAVSLEDLQVYYRKNVKKFAPTKKHHSGVTEATDTTAESSKPSDVVESKENEDKKPETKEAETGEIKEESKESDDKKPEIEEPEIKEVKESDDKKPETKEETKESEDKKVDLTHIFYSNIAHATQTGEGLLFYYKSDSETHTKHPIGVINLKEVTDVKELNEHAMGKPYPFKVETSYRVFELAADSKLDRDSWILSIKEKVETAKRTSESIEKSDGYKDTYEKLAKGSDPFTATKEVMSDEVFSGDEEVDKSKPAESKRKSIFPFFGGRKPSMTEATSTTITTTETTDDGKVVTTTTTTTSEVITSTEETEEATKSDDTPKSPQRSSKSYFNIFRKKSEKEESATATIDEVKDEKITEETNDAETSAAAATETKEAKDKDHKDGGIINKFNLFAKSKQKDETHKEGETAEVDSTPEATPGDKVEESDDKKVEKEEPKDGKEPEKKEEKKEEEADSSDDKEKSEPYLVRKVTKMFKRSKSPRAEEKKPEVREATTSDKQETTEEVKETSETTEPTEPAQTSEQIVPESSTEQTEDKKKEKSNIFINLGRRISSVAAKRQNSLPTQDSTQENEIAETAETSDVAIATATDATDDNVDKTVKTDKEKEKEPEAAVQKPVIPEGIKKGTLQKQSQILKQFYHRYFVLTEDKKLHYYRTENDPTTEKIIDLSADCKVKITDGNKFDLETKTRTYKFIADSEEDRESWIKELKESGVSAEEPQSSSSDNKPEESQKLEVTKSSENEDDIQKSVDKAADAVEASVAEGQETTTTTASKLDTSETVETVETVVIEGETETTTKTITTTTTVEESK